MISEERKNLLKLFSEGRELYKNRNFKMAQNKFAEALNIDRDDGPSRVYFDRCKLYIDNPPPDDWDGVFDMKTK